MEDRLVSVAERDWRVNEYNIIVVRLALGGEFAELALLDCLFRYSPNGVTAREISDTLEGLLKIEGKPDLGDTAQIVVSYWSYELAAGRPIDDRARELVAEWHDRQLNSAKSGRRSDSKIKKLAVQMQYRRFAAALPNKRGSKKQMHYHLQDKFGLKRSQLSKLLSGLDPWKEGASKK